MHIEMIILPSGNLRLVADEEAREEARDKIEAGINDDVGILLELTEDHWTNGGFEPFDGGQGNPFVGLTDAPCIAESMDIDGEGQRTINGRLWFYPEYMVMNPVAELADHGYVEFTKVGRS